MRCPPFAWGELLCRQPVEGKPLKILLNGFTSQLQHPRKQLPDHRGYYATGYGGTDKNMQEALIGSGWAAIFQKVRKPWRVA